MNATRPIHGGKETGKPPTSDCTAPQSLLRGLWRGMRHGKPGGNGRRPDAPKGGLSLCVLPPFEISLILHFLDVTIDAWITQDNDAEMDS